MTNLSLFELLQKYHPTDMSELEAKKRMLVFIKTYPNCFERSLDIGHITASCWLINSTNTHALLMLHAKLNIWVQLGGHCDGDSNVLAVALKEACEESGLTYIKPVTCDLFDIDIHEFPESKFAKKHDHYDVRFLLQAHGSDEIIQNSESKELRWISKNPKELPTQHTSVTRMFEKWILKDL